MSDQLVTVEYRVPGGQWYIGQTYPRNLQGTVPWVDGKVVAVSNYGPTLESLDERLRKLECP